MPKHGRKKVRRVNAGKASVSGLANESFVRAPKVHTSTEGKFFRGNAKKYQVVKTMGGGSRVSHAVVSEEKKPTLHRVDARKPLVMVNKNKTNHGVNYVEGRPTVNRARMAWVQGSKVMGGGSGVNYAVVNKGPTVNRARLAWVQGSKVMGGGSGVNYAVVNKGPTVNRARMAWVQGSKVMGGGSGVNYAVVNKGPTVNRARMAWAPGSRVMIGPKVHRVETIPRQTVVHKAFEGMVIRTGIGKLSRAVASRMKRPPKTGMIVEGSQIWPQGKKAVKGKVLMTGAQNAKFSWVKKHYVGPYTVEGHNVKGHYRAKTKGKDLIQF